MPRRTTPVPPIPDNVADPLLSKAQVAVVLGVDPWTIDRYRKDPRQRFPLCCWIAPSTPRWRKSEIDSWLSSRQHGGSAPDFNRDPSPKKKRRVRA